MIPSHIIEKVIAAANIEDVVSDYVVLKKRGTNLVGLCPFHTERTPSFSVSPVKGIYKCFGCGKSGHAINFIMEIEQCSFIDAVKHLANKYHIEVIEKELTPEDIQRRDDKESLLALNDFAVNWFKQQLWDTDEGKSVALQYLYSRGMTDETINLFQLGYSPKLSTALASALLTNGFKKEYITNDPNTLMGTGLCYEVKHDELIDRFRDRIIFPVRSVSGKVVAFVGRLLVKKENTGKYVNSPESLLYSKSNELYGLFYAKQYIAKADLCYLVEGQMDVLSMFQAGIKNVVASGGTALTQKQIQSILRFTSNITVLYDGDAAGIHAALRGLDMLLENNCNVNIVLLPNGEDPDSFSKKTNAADFTHYLNENSTDFIQFKTNLLNNNYADTPTQKTKLIKDIIASIAYIPDRIKREVYIQKTSQKIDISEQSLLQEVNAIRRQRYQNSLSTQDTTVLPSPPQQNNNEQNAPTPIPQLKNTWQNKLNAHFNNLLRVIIKYGHRTLFNSEQNNETIFVGHFIIQQLKNDNINLPDPHKQKILDEYEKHYLDDLFNSENFFTLHTDPDISKLAIELTTEKYIKSNLFSQQVIAGNIIIDTKDEEQAYLDDMVPHLILELKETLVEKKIDDLAQEIKNAELNEQWEVVRTKITEMGQYNDIKKQICKQLGNRIITPIKPNG